MKTTVVFHRSDFDGLFSAAVCRKFLPDAEFIGWDFGDPLPKVETEQVYVVDLPPDCFERTLDGHELIWIDHHKSSIDKWDANIRGYRIDGVAACRLCWEWFRGMNDGTPQDQLARKEWFTERKNPYEPLALTLAGEYDIWDKRDERAEAFQFGLTAFIHGCTNRYEPLIDLFDNAQAEYVAKLGIHAQRWQQAFALEVCKERSYVREWEGRTFCVLGSAHARNSMWFPQEAIPKKCDALMCWRYDGERVSFSLYRAPGHEEHDLSQIAVKYGGGGHRGACGFALSLDEALEVIR